MSNPCPEGVRKLIQYNDAIRDTNQESAKKYKGKKNDLEGVKAALQRARDTIVSHMKVCDRCLVAQSTKKLRPLAER